MNVTPPKQDTEMEKAISMVVDCVRKNCRNPKPLILHSIRVGLKLVELKQPKETIIAGILHDLVEDTNLTVNQVKKEFGPRVAKLVSALSQEKIGDYQKRWHVLMAKIRKAGKPAMMIKLIDIHDNLVYLPLIKSPQDLKEIHWKHNFAMGELKPYLGRLKIFRDCRCDYHAIFKKLGIE